MIKVLSMEETHTLAQSIINTNSSDKVITAFCGGGGGGAAGGGVWAWR